MKINVACIGLEGVDEKKWRYCQTLDGLTVKEFMNDVLDLKGVLDKGLKVMVKPQRQGGFMATPETVLTNETIMILDFTNVPFKRG